jgi:hypothetical protein
MKNSEFSAHSVFDKLKQFETRIHSKEASEKIDIENLDFYRSSAAYVRSQMDKAITVLINPAELNDVSSLLDNCLTQLNEFLGNANVGHLNNIESYLYPMLRLVRNIPLPNASDDFSYSQLINDFKKLAAEKVAELSIEFESVQEIISNVNGDLNQRKIEIQAVDKIITDKQIQIDGLNQSFQSNFDLIKSTETTKFEDLRDRLKKNLEDQTKIIDDNTKSLVDRLNTKEEEAKKLVNVIGNIGATGNYRLAAEAEGESADLWRYVAIGFMGTLSAILIWTLFDLGGDKYDWKTALIRIPSALVLTYPATYAARESAKHRKLENLNRKAELELASINPFIEILSEEKKQAIKEKLVEKYFGNNEGYTENDQSDDTHSVPFKVLDKVVDIFKEVKKS